MHSIEQIINFSSSMSWKFYASSYENVIIIFMRDKKFAKIITCLNMFKLINVSSTKSYFCIEQMIFHDRILILMLQLIVCLGKCFHDV